MPRAPDFERIGFLKRLTARRRRILLVALAVIVLAAAGAFLLPAQYTSAAVVMLDQRQNPAPALSGIPSQPDTGSAALQNQIEILTSRELAIRIITRLKLYDDPEFNPVLVPQGPAGMVRWHFWFPGTDDGDVAVIHDRIRANFMSRISVAANGLSTAITIEATAGDPKKARDIANAIAQTYIGDQRGAGRSANQETSDWLDKRTSELSQQMMRQEQALQLYKAQHNLGDSTPASMPPDQQLAATNAQIAQARSALARKQVLSDRVAAAAIAGNATDVGPIMASPLIVQLRGQQADLARQEADLSTRYGPLHPRLQAVQAQERDITGKIAQEINRIATSLNNDVVTARTHLASLEQKLIQVERQSSTQTLARVELQALQSNVDSTRAQYEALLGRLHQTQEQDDALPLEARIISFATLPLAPSTPPRRLMIGASIPLGLLLGILAALLAAPANATAKALDHERPAPVKQAQTRPLRDWIPPSWDGPPVLAELANAERMGAAAYVVDYPGSRYAAAMSALVGQFDSHDRGGAIVAITSAQDSESKSAVAVSLARAAAQMGRKTVLVDCDPRQLASTEMQATSQAGLYEVLTGAVPLSRALARDCRSGVYGLAMTHRPAKLSAMFASAAMARLLQILKEGADLVVLDCSLADDGPEAGLLARQGDATLVVTRKDALGQSALSKSLAALTGAHAAPLAIVATK